MRFTLAMQYYSHLGQIYTNVNLT